MKGKQVGYPFTTSSNKQVVAERLDIIHSNLCGLIPVASLGGMQYNILTFVDDHTRKKGLCLFSVNKVAICKCTKDLARLLVNQCDKKVTVLSTYNGRGYVNKGM